MSLGGPHRDPDETLLRGRRGVQLIATGVFALAIIGFFAGVRGPTAPAEPVEEPLAAPIVPEEGVIPSTWYWEVPQRFEAAGRYASRLAEHRPAPAKPITAETELVLRQVALAARARNRAYNGAPPTIPHPIDARNIDGCLACHGEGMVLADGLIATRMPHEHLPGCTQCHVPAPPSSAPAPEARGNRFFGIEAPFEGQRAWEGAPPTIPHSTLMRTDCLSCHGPAGRPGMRTSHPERLACMQCHAPSADKDHAPLGAALFLQPPGIVGSP